MKEPMVPCRNLWFLVGTCGSLYTMKIIKDLAQLNITEKTAVAIGKFDGLHLGHQKLLSRLIDQKKKGLKTVVITFDPPPEVYFGKSENKQLLTAAEKEAMLIAMGVDLLFYFPMNEVNAAMTAEAFVDNILLTKLNMAYICAGEDLRFGARGHEITTGDSAFILAMAEKRGFIAQIVAKMLLGEREISSSYIREALESTDMSLAAALLGRPYAFSGTVMGGNKLGRTLGFPTANLAIQEMKIKPPHGVYKSVVLTPFGEFAGISNIGIKPTIDGERRPGIETHLYDFSEDLYGETITVFLLAFIRPEMKFTDIDALKAQVEEDSMKNNSKARKNRT